MAYRTAAQIRNHRFVESLHQEDDGYCESGRPAWWCYVKPGFIVPEMECGTIHECTLRAVNELLDTVRPKTDEEAANSYYGTDTPEELAEARRIFEENGGVA